MKKRSMIGLSVFILSLYWAVDGLCGQAQDEMKVFAIQKKVFHRYHEIGLCTGYIPDDDFYNVYPIGINYIFNFNDWISWEVARLQKMVNQEKEIKSKLEEEFGVTPSEFSEPTQMIHSQVIIRPFYGKNAVWNKGIVNNETYLFLGGGMVSYKKDFPYGESETENVSSFSVGLGTKYFINQNLAINFEIRNLMNFKEEETVNNTWFGVNISFRFNLSERKTETDSTLENLKRYLEK